MFQNLIPNLTLKLFGSLNSIKTNNNNNKCFNSSKTSVKNMHVNSANVSSGISSLNECFVPDVCVSKVIDNVCDSSSSHVLEVDCNSVVKGFTN